MPGQRPVAWGVPWPLTGGVHVKSRVPAPPVTSTRTSPSQSPGQLTSLTVGVAVMPSGWSTLKETVVSQPVAVSTMCRAYGPGHRPSTLGVPWPLPPGGGSQVYSRVPVAPPTTAVAVPLQALPHPASVKVRSTVRGGAVAMVKSSSTAQPWLSSTCTA